MRVCICVCVRENVCVCIYERGVLRYQGYEIYYHSPGLLRLLRLFKLFLSLFLSLFSGRVIRVLLAPIPVVTRVIKVIQVTFLSLSLCLSLLRVIMRIFSGLLEGYYLPFQAYRP